jgi:RNA polymerase sigma factor (sigma-70 family)
MVRPLGRQKLKTGFASEDDMSLPDHDVAQPNPAQQQLTLAQLGELLDDWRARELRLARRFRACADLAEEQLQDLYQEAVTALLAQRFTDELKLRDALRAQIRLRALQVHRDERNHRNIRARYAPGIQRLAQARASEQTPEQQLLEDEDRLVIREFLLGELTPFEREVFWWKSQSGLSSGYNRIARRVGRPVPEVRRALRSAEQKSDRFAVLYSTGRLCGYRSQTIQALKEGKPNSTQQLDQAIAHLEACRACRAEHHLTADGLRDTFEQQAAVALAPLIPGLPSQHHNARIALKGRSQRAASRALERYHHLHDRLAGVYLASTNGGKVVRAAGLALLAGGTLTATHVLTPTSHPTHPATTVPVPPTLSSSALAPLATTSTAWHAQRPTSSPPLKPVRPRATPSHLPRAPGHVVTPGTVQPPNREPGGFAYLGVSPKQPASTDRPNQRQIPGSGEFSP